MTSTSSTPLLGLRVLVASDALEMRAHRGVASFSKVLIATLHALGAEVYLLTGVSPVRASYRALRRLGRVGQRIAIADICGDLARSSDKGVLRFSSRVRSNFVNLLAPVLANVLMPWFCLIGAKGRFFRIGARDEVIPYLQMERTRYLESIKGFVTVPLLWEVQKAWSVWGPGFRPTIRVKMDQFDVFLTASPTALQLKSGLTRVPQIQVVHDIFSLRFADHSTEPIRFSHILSAASRDTLAAVSKGTADQLVDLNLDGGRKPSVIYQPPNIANDQVEAVRAFLPLHQLDKYRYFLVIAPNDPIKNLDFLFSTFAVTRLAEQGIKLLVVSPSGPKENSGEGLRPNVVHLSSVSEELKAWLVIHCIALMSPSLDEGYGLTVLEAACLGTPVICSSIASHVEISERVPGAEIELKSTATPALWIQAMQAAYSRLDHLLKTSTPELISQERTKHFEERIQSLQNDFSNSLISLFGKCVPHKFSGD